MTADARHTAAMAFCLPASSSSFSVASSQLHAGTFSSRVTHRVILLVWMQYATSDVQK